MWYTKLLSLHYMKNLENTKNMNNKNGEDIGENEDS